MTHLNIDRYLTPTAKAAWDDMKVTVVDRDYIDRDGHPSHCWIPPYQPDGNGYVRVQRRSDDGRNGHYACHLLALLYGNPPDLAQAFAEALRSRVYEANHLCRQSDCCNPDHIALCGTSRNRGEHGNRVERKTPRTNRHRFAATRSNQRRKGRDVGAYDRIRECVEEIAEQEGVPVPDALWVFVTPSRLRRLWAAYSRRD